MSKLAVFIDADNFADCTALDHAMKAVQGLGEQLVFKHAYGNAQSLKSIEVVLAKYGVRPISNLVVGKTTTDVALAIGAIEAICRNPEIRVAVICSGDADFAPLAIRLQELGCKTICIGLHGIIFRSADAFYDEIIEIKVIESPVDLAQPALILAKNTLSIETKTISNKAFAPVQPQQPIPIKTTISNTNAISVKQVLKACPALKNGEWLAMSVVVRALREAKAIGKKTALQQWLNPILSHFEVELTPGHKNQIRYKESSSQNAPSAMNKSITAQHILQVCPALTNKQWTPLGMVVKGLRDQRRISQSTKLKGWLLPLGSSFEWQPSTAPNQIRWRGQ